MGLLKVKKQTWLVDLILRKHYQDGVIEYALKDDPYVDEAIKILKDTSKYNNILFP